MLKRIYIDNFRSLVNFELPLAKVNLLMGGNGSGKSTVFEVLERIRRLVLAGHSVDNAFVDESLTRWQERDVQTFEIDLETGDGALHYHLEILMDPIISTVHKEMLSLNQAPVFTREHDAGTFTEFPDARPMVFDRERSAFSLLKGRSSAIKRFSAWFRQLHVVALRPSMIDAWSEAEVRGPSLDFADFASWYRHLIQSRGPEMEEAREALRGVLDGFFGLRLQDSGRSEAGRKLITEWRLGGGKKVTYAFDELSDGQRALIALYVLLYSGGDDPMTIAIDEPDNFVALPEIQPWLGALSERPALQSLLISHHPEILNMHALDAGIVFRRDDGGPTRIERFVAEPGETLTPAELVARGWIRGAG